MFTKNQSTTVKNFIEVFFAAILIVFSMSSLIWSHNNHFINMGASAFFISGVLIIIKANWEYKKRKQQEQNENLQ